jgi:hypothetical protein
VRIQGNGLRIDFEVLDKDVAQMAEDFFFGHVMPPWFSGWK